MTHILACDLGGSSFRAALVDPAGRIPHLVSVPMTAGNDTEVDPRVWWSALCAASDALAAESGTLFDGVAALAISGFTRTQVFLGADHRILRPAITWHDARAETRMPEIRAALPPAHPERTQLNAYHPAARLGWLARAEPDVAHAMAAVIEPKDYLNLCLTGTCAIDTVGSARLIAAAGPPGASILEALGYSAAILPRALEPTSIMGQVRAALPGALARLSGRPVLAMANDTWAAAVGLGALRDGHAYNLSGTTEVFGAITSRALTAEGLLTVDWGGGLYQLGGPSLCGGDTLVWLLRLLGHAGPVGPALHALLAERGDPQPVLFLPYLQGERTPHWDPALRGAFIGLNRNHGPADSAHAVLQGIGFLNRTVLQRAEAAIGQPVSEIRFGGGGAANDIWCQMKADICERPVAVIACDEPGVLGAGVVAFTALGVHASFASGQRDMVMVRQRFEPAPGPAAHYRALYELFRQAETALTPLSHALAGMRA